MKIEGNTKFNVGDICYGFVDNDIHTFRIDKIEVSFETNPITKITKTKVIYVVILIDSKVNPKYTREEDQLFHNEEEVIAHITNYFKNRKIIIKYERK